MNEVIKTKLTEKACEETVPFCYHCHMDCPEGTCPGCGSDDLMRHLPGVGVEYGTDWTFPYLLDGIQEADTGSAFESMLEGCYGDTATVGFLKVGLVRTMKECDPVSWNLAKIDYIDGLVGDESLAQVGDKYYWTSDIESRL